MSVYERGLLPGLVRLCAAHGVATSAERLGDGLLSAPGVLPFVEVERALRRVNMTCGVVGLPLSKISHHALPVLLLMRDGSCLVLEKLMSDAAEVSHPESGAGRSALPRDALEDGYAGHYLIAKHVEVVSPHLDASFDGKPRHWILGPVREQWRIYRDVLLASLMANLLAVGTALFSMQVYDRVVPNAAFDTLWVLASGVGIAILLEWVLRYMRARLIDHAGRALDLRLSAQLFERVVHMRFAHRPTSIGVFANQVRDFASVRDFFTSGTLATLCDLPFMVVLLALIGVIGGWAVLVVLAAVVLIVLPGMLMQGRLADLSRQNAKESAALNGLLLEAVDNLENVKATRSEERLQRAHASLTAIMATSGTKTRDVTGMLQLLGTSTQQLCYTAVVIVGVYLITAGDLTTGSMVACTLLSSRVLMPMSQVAGLLARWQFVKAAMEGLDRIVALPIERPVERHFVRAEHLRGAYRLENVQYAHDAESAPALQIGRLSIKAGERVALLGGNGAGKSTLMRLLAGLTDPQQGNVLLDDLAIAQIDPIDRRRQIAYLPQSVALFQGTLRENLTLGHALWTDAQLYDALDAVGLGTFVRKHVRGLDQDILSIGNISGGQKQAIGLARVILQDPRIVILDEPTSAFDQANEAKVVSFLKTWLHGRTAIIATHKRELLALTQRAVVLHDGKVVHDGEMGKLVELASAQRAKRAPAAPEVKVVSENAS
ncbi:ATP-binding cassette, subfamily C, LapB [Chitinasiproducens palmae]|uniref:ATP-binding cassette, subfamily C, LapB n=2 Tax=Chitinasiproducens palmae TaxID=1770053 RepID=A0A1H2PIV9_9BURK|nr:ATP-binding cassette, subfamily C, LapB [Chitinasiproducens palmae]